MADHDNRFRVEKELVRDDSGHSAVVQWGEGSERFTLATFEGPSGLYAAKAVCDLLNAHAAPFSWPGKWNG